MSRENIELIHRGLRLFSDGGFDEIESHVNPDIVAEGPEGWPDGGVEFSGRKAVVGQMARLSEDFDRHELIPIGTEAKGDWVVVRGRYEVIGSASGLELTAEASIACRLLDGMLREARVYWDHDEALAAAGIDGG